MEDRRMTAVDHEEIHVRRGRRTGLYIAVAIHSTLLGPALGGARLWRYATPGDAIADALRLSAAMTAKAAAAGLDLGGGKCVVCAEGEIGPQRRRELMLDLGDAVGELDGRYITAEDVGTSSADMAVVAERTPHVVGLPPERGGRGDPSPVTARGVEAAIRACLRHRFGNPDPSGRTVCVIGLGHVGLDLAERLAAVGADLIVTDVDRAKRRDAERLSARWVHPRVASEAKCDVLAPCALGGVVDAETVERLRCEIVCGSANNLLASESAGDRLAQREILYAPDFIANAGGLISVYGELCDLPRERIDELVAGIGDAVADVLADAERDGVTPLAAARAAAQRRLAGRGGQPPRLASAHAG
jgi:leucine dehydrogenase